MDQLPKISIVTPSYNQGEFIEETILSVLDQGYANLEYLVIDGGSTDNSVDVIKKYADRISYWVSEPDKGQSDAINKGLKRASGDIVAWLNSDDIYCAGTLQKVADTFVKDQNAGIVYGDVESFFPDGSTEIWHNKFEAEDFLNRVSIHQPGVFWKRELHETYGYLDPSFYYLMDYDLWARLFFNTPSVDMPEVLTRFRVHDKAKTGQNPAGLYDDYRRVVSRFANSLTNTTMKEEFEAFGLYANEENARYVINAQFTAAQVDKFISNYIYNCIVQEYTRGNWHRTNWLILQTLRLGKVSAKLAIFIKNNLGIALLKKR